MSNASVRVAVALFMVLTPPTVSFARGGGGHGGGHASLSAMGGFSRPAGSAGTGNVPISGIAPGPANLGGINNTRIDPSGIGNAAKITTPPQPNIAAPMLPGGPRIPAAPAVATPSPNEMTLKADTINRITVSPRSKAKYLGTWRAGIDRGGAVQPLGETHHPMPPFKSATSLPVLHE